MLIWVFKTLLGGAGLLLVLAILYVAASVFSLIFLERDPLDRFEVVATKPNGAGRHIVTFKYHHANSSNDLFAAWVLADKPKIGSTEAPPGRDNPVIAWTNWQNVISLDWSANRIKAKIKKDTVREKGFLHCYFGGQMRGEAKRVCFNPERVELSVGM